MRTTTLIIAGAALAFAAAPAGAAEDGAALFAKHCAACHGKAGKADTKPAEMLGIKPFSEVADLQTKPADELLGVLKANDKHKAPVKALSDEQLKAVLEYVKTLGAS